MRMDEIDDHLLERLVSIDIGGRAAALIEELSATFRVVAVGWDDFAFLFPAAAERVRALRRSRPTRAACLRETA